MTRLRARGGIRDRPPIIDEDDDDMMFNPAPVVVPRKRKVGRKPAVERVEKERHVVEKVVVDRERDVNLDENSLYYIMRHSKSAIAVNIFFISCLFCFNAFIQFAFCLFILRALLTNGSKAINRTAIWH